jgi:ubiquinone/menaquinone biosynthesis C-methylase UbiE
MGERRDDSATVLAHYTTDDIAGRIVAAMRMVVGDQAPLTPDILAQIDHFHGGGLSSTRDLVAALQPQAGERILDIGSGIGGPARWIASTFRCHVTGIDLTPAFCRAAEQLNQVTGLVERVRIVEGSALAMPFDDGGFYRAYSQNVVMNIADKPGFYREASRVLKPGGLLALSNAAAGPNGPPCFPVPWATSPDASFLSSPAETRNDLKRAGFEILRFEDVSAKTAVARKALRERLEREGLPPLGFHVFMGERFKEAQINGARNAEEGRISSVEILVRKPPN